MLQSTWGLTIAQPAALTAGSITQRRRQNWIQPTEFRHHGVVQGLSSRVIDSDPDHHSTTAAGTAALVEHLRELVIDARRSPEATSQEPRSAKPDEAELLADASAVSPVGKVELGRGVGARAHSLDLPGRHAGTR